MDSPDGILLMIYQNQREEGFIFLALGIGVADCLGHGKRDFRAHEDTSLSV